MLKPTTPPSVESHLFARLSIVGEHKPDLKTPVATGAPSGGFVASLQTGWSGMCLFFAGVATVAVTASLVVTSSLDETRDALLALRMPAVPPSPAPPPRPPSSPALEAVELRVDTTLSSGSHISCPAASPSGYLAVKIWNDAMPSLLFNQHQYYDSLNAEISTERSVYHYVVGGTVQKTIYNDPYGKYLPVATAARPLEASIGVSAPFSTILHGQQRIVTVAGAPVYVFTGGQGFWENPAFFEVRSVYGINASSWLLVLPDGSSSPTGCAPTQPPSAPPPA